jgi:hypothetical protein
MHTETTLIVDDGKTGARPIVVWASRSAVEQWRKIGKPFYVDSPESSTGRIRIDPAHVIGFEGDDQVEHAWRVVFRGQLGGAMVDRLRTAGISQCGPTSSRGSADRNGREIYDVPLRVVAPNPDRAYVRLAEILGDQIRVVETPTRLDE